MSELSESLNKCKVEGNTLFLPPISEGMLPNYKEVRQALINAGAKYNKNKFVFSSDAQPFIDRLCGGEVVNIKKTFQAFYTPDILAGEVVQLAKIKSTHSVLEPSGGEGALIKAVHKLFPKLSVYYCELMPENRQILNIINHTKIIFEDFLKIHHHYLDLFKY